MKQYIWFHPAYIKQANTEDGALLIGQMKNAARHGYTILADDKLGVVSSEDHLTIVGHTTPPEDHDGDDTGLFIQGETSDQLIERVTSLGLKKAPKILSLECCGAAVENGLAQQLSMQAFLKDTLIEANKGGIGRDPGKIFRNLITDGFGRVIVGAGGNSWIYFRRGQIVNTRAHSNASIKQILSHLEDFHDRFFQHYRPGLFGLSWLGQGRVGRYFKQTGSRLTREKVLEFVKEGPADSATAQTLKKLEEQKSFNSSANP